MVLHALHLCSGYGGFELALGDAARTVASGRDMTNLSHLAMLARIPTNECVTWDRGRAGRSTSAETDSYPKPPDTHGTNSPPDSKGTDQ